MPDWHYNLERAHVLKYNLINLPSTAICFSLYIYFTKLAVPVTVIFLIFNLFIHLKTLLIPVKTLKIEGEDGRRSFSGILISHPSEDSHPPARCTRPSLLLLRLRTRSTTTHTHAMLSAEHYALEHRAVQALLDIRQREVAYMTERFNSIGTQSSLIAGLVVTTLTALDPGGEDSDTLEIVRQLFWASSGLALALSLHCILNSTFAAVWGPGLALRGPTGSVSRAYWNMVQERNHIMLAFVGSLFFLLTQSILAFFILDRTKGITSSSIIGTCILALGAAWSSRMLWRMQQRFFFSDADAAMGVRFAGEDAGRGAASGGGSGPHAGDINPATMDPDELVDQMLMGDRRGGAEDDFAYLDIETSNDKNDPARGSSLTASLLNRGGGGLQEGGAKTKTVVSSAAAAGGNGAGATKAPSSGSSMAAAEKKAATHAAFVPRAAAASLGTRAEYFVHQGYLEKKGRLTGAWRKRFFRLQGTTLFYWDTQEEFEEFLRTTRDRRVRPKSISLKGYQILVKTRRPRSDDDYVFVFDAMDDGTNKRNREFRVPSEAALRSWVGSLVAASLVAQ